MPVLASTEFSGCVNIWSMQNIGEQERQKIAVQEAEAEKVDEGTEEEENDEEMEEPSSSSNQTVMIRGSNGQVYRVPMSLLRRIMGNEESEEEKAAA